MIRKLSDYVLDFLVSERMKNYADYWKNEAPSSEQALFPIFIIGGIFMGVIPALIALWLSWKIAQDRMVEVKQNRSVQTDQQVHGTDFETR